MKPHVTQTLDELRATVQQLQHTIHILEITFADPEAAAPIAIAPAPNNGIVPRRTPPPAAPASPSAPPKPKRDTRTARNRAAWEAFASAVAVALKDLPGSFTIREARAAVTAKHPEYADRLKGTGIYRVFELQGIQKMSSGQWQKPGAKRLADQPRPSSLVPAPAAPSLLDQIHADIASKRKDQPTP